MSWFLPELSEKLQNKIIDKAKLNLSDDILPIYFRKVIQMTINLINQYKENKKIFKEDKMRQKKMEKLDEQYQLANKLSTVEALKKTASFVKTEEFKSKSKVKSSDSTDIKAAIKKMTNKFTNLALVMRVQSNQIQGNSNQGISTHLSYFYCEKPGHHQSQYYKYQSDISNKYCYIDDKENLHMGSKSQNYQAVTLKPGILNMFLVQPMEENK
ncbi:conserved hypothetical protein [Coccidioides posadasii str. Silveira]|uniref:Uncharacterized protein n=1 Tax=Coccidioides posadasii (strain RMSCC 757 / Silveira) TaxID=443226 RepID=E9D871_COCPS|nr:conserved hypothetical protein [Coccidioides posadasii str. Silveira]